MKDKEWMLNRFIRKHYSWINPILIILVTGSAALITYSLSPEFTRVHPVKTIVINYVLSNVGLVFWPCLFALGQVTYLDIKDRKTIYELEQAISEYEEISEKISENIKELFNGFLYKFSTSQLDFTPSERVTLYIHDGNNVFVPFGRYSSNTSFSKNGRPEYPDSVGCVAYGWTDEWHFFQSQYCPVTQENKYIDEQKKKYSLDKEVVKEMNMKSRQICVMRLDILNKPMGVIVVESTKQDKYKEDKIKTALYEQKEYLAQMISALNKYIPKPSRTNNIEDI